MELIHNEGGNPAGVSIGAHVKGSAIIPRLKGDHPICPEINEEPAAIITMHLMMMLLLLWHALVKLIIQSRQMHVRDRWNTTAPSVP